MAAYDKTILSAGTRLRAALEPVVAAHGARIFPVVSAVDEQLPFVTYFRAGTSETGVKPPGAGPRESSSSRYSRPDTARVLKSRRRCSRPLTVSPTTGSAIAR